MFKYITELFSKILNLQKMVIINDVSYAGRSVIIRNGKVIIDGQDVTPSGKEINIRVEGNIDSLRVDYCEKIDVTGSVGSLNSVAANVSCGDVSGGIETTSGDITCKNVNGNINTTSGDIKSEGAVTGSIETLSGDVECGNVGGKVETMSGDISHK